jgi:Phage tail lysozyme
VTSPQPTGGSSSAGTSGSGGSTTPSAVTPEQIWQDLEQYGASAIVAAGVMGNMIAESSLNPEAVNPADSNGYPSYGLMQWNTASYPSAASLVTGNPVTDALAQVVFFFQTVPQSALQGSTAQAVASNIAANYERCSTCQSGGTSNEQRQANAATVAGWASSGNWPATTGQASDTATLTSAQSAEGNLECAWQIGFGGIPGTSWLADLFGSGGNIASGSVCIVSKTQVRGVLSAAVLVGGALLGVVAVGWLLNTSTGGALGRAAGKAGRSVAEAGAAAAVA